MAGEARFGGGVNFTADGARLHCGTAVSDSPSLLELFPENGRDAGIRIANLGSLAKVLAADGAIGSLNAAVIGPAARPVRAIAFDKNAERNWSLGWHQDRTICVQERADIAGFGPWSTKQGMTHVQPPFDLLRQMVTARIHLDDVDEGNAPLKIALGSHLLVQIPEPDVDATVQRSEEFACLAQAGDVWLYSTPILHASAKASGLAPCRRVLQVDCSADPLPRPLRWALE